MGIKGLKAIIKKHVPEGITEIQLKNLKGKKICIDSSILIYKFRYLYSSDNFHIIGFLHKIVEYLEYGIIPIFVFDGKPPDAKKETLQKRKETREKLQQKVEKLKVNVSEFIEDSDDEVTIDTVAIYEEITRLEKNILIITKQHYLDVKTLLEYIGISYYNSYGEAEEFCAFLQKKGVVDYILTEDTDSLTFGGSNVIFTSKNNYTLYNLNFILAKLEMEMDEFIDLCILCGCDYTCTIPKIGPVNAFNIIKKFKSIDAFLIENKKYTIPENFDYLTSRQLFKQNENFEIPSLIIKEMDIKKLTDLLSENKINTVEYFVNKIINLINFNFPKNKFLGEY